MTEFDEDLLARQEARMLCRRAGQAQQTLETLTQEKLENSVQIAWATGGRLVPEEVRKAYLETYIG